MRATIGRGLQILGLVLSGYAVITPFFTSMSEGAMFMYGFGGLLIFVVGTKLLGG